MLPRTVVVLGLVSLLNDAASEMITPLLPIFLTATLGAGPAIVGLVEGLAEATASLLKLYSGRLADRGVPAKRPVIGGYALSNTMRPLIGLAAHCSSTSTRCGAKGRNLPDSRWWRSTSKSPPES